jgi:hypothetical protein
MTDEILRRGRLFDLPTIETIVDLHQFSYQVQVLNNVVLTI